MTPFKAVYGRDPPSLLRYEKGNTSNGSLEQQLLDRDDILEESKSQLLRAQQSVTKSANQHHRDIQFQVGDRVFLKLCPYRQLSLAKNGMKSWPRVTYGHLLLWLESDKWLTM